MCAHMNLGNPLFHSSDIRNSIQKGLFQMLAVYNIDFFFNSCRNYQKSPFHY